MTELRLLCEANEIPLSEDQAVLVVRHLQLMLEKNRKVNLTAIRDPRVALVLHSFDSLLFSRVVACLGATAWTPAGLTLSTIGKGDTAGCACRFPSILDIGTGGGFPGIPLACSCPCEVTLLDSVGKKVAACLEFVSALGLDAKVTCVHDRVESFARSHRSLFDFVVARALAPLDVLIEYSEPVVRTGGFLVFSKGTPEIEELENATFVAGLCGFENVSRETFDLPFGMGRREFFVYKKVRKSKVNLPRSVGEARKHQLAYSAIVSRETSRKVV